MHSVKTKTNFFPCCGKGKASWFLCVQIRWTVQIFSLDRQEGCDIRKTVDKLMGWNQHFISCFACLLLAQEISIRDWERRFYSHPFIYTEWYWILIESVHTFSIKHFFSISYQLLNDKSVLCAELCMNVLRVGYGEITLRITMLKQRRAKNNVHFLAQHINFRSTGVWVDEWIIMARSVRCIHIVHCEHIHSGKKIHCNFNSCCWWLKPMISKTFLPINGICIELWKALQLFQQI